MLYPSLTTTDFTVITGFTFYIDVVYLLSAAFIEGYIGQVYTDKSIYYRVHWLVFMRGIRDKFYIQIYKI